MKTPSKWVDISIPLIFDGAQPNVYGVATATGTACRTGTLVGDTREGGSCNFEEYRLIPHCNGTHTECVGHITEERISVRQCLEDVLMSALLISVAPIEAVSCGESYASRFDTTDRMLSASDLHRAIGDMRADALIIRTLPNAEEKLKASYADSTVPFLSNDAMKLINESDFKHLLVDLPSIDRLSDEGKLSNHRIFWGMELGTTSRPSVEFCKKTVTEFIFVPNYLEDGLYELNLQIAPFETDASPSRPLLRSLK